MNKTSGRATAVAFLLWAVILFLFAMWPGEPDWLVWTMRVLALLSGLIGVMGLCTELARKKGSIDGTGRAD